MDKKNAINELSSFLHFAGIEVPNETPLRIVNMYDEFFVDPAQPPIFHFTTFPNNEKLRDMVIVKNIRFFSMCEHHLIPFFGYAHVGYLPHDKIVGISKIPRVVDWFARRPQLQERLANQVASYLEDELRPKGVGVLMEATHLCMAMRGIQRPEATTVVSAMRGSFLATPKVRDEFYAAIGRRAT